MSNVRGARDMRKEKLAKVIKFLETLLPAEMLHDSYIYFDRSLETNKKELVERAQYARDMVYFCCPSIKVYGISWGWLDVMNKVEIKHARRLARKDAKNV